MSSSTAERAGSPSLPLASYSIQIISSPPGLPSTPWTTHDGGPTQKSVDIHLHHQDHLGRHSVRTLLGLESLGLAAQPDGGALTQHVGGLRFA